MGAESAWSFRCNACGKCCNSAPELSVPELFRHQDVFVGALTLRRVRGTQGGDDLLLVTRGLGDDGASRCPALADDNRCSLHDNGKPAACRVVPLDALVADRLQHDVLAERAGEAAYLGADCIARGSREGYTPLVQRLRVADEGALAALAERRRALADEKRFWGNAVFRALKHELFAQPAVLESIPEGGFLALPLAPVLLALGEVSVACRARSSEYVDAQLVLAERLLRRVNERPRDTASAPSSETYARELGAAVRTLTALRRAFAQPWSEASRRPDAPSAADTEAWLGLEQTWNTPKRSSARQLA